VLVNIIFIIVLIISPWNYPISLVMKPLIGCIAAGNCCVIKPSEVSTNVEKTFEKLVPKYLDKNIIRCVTGGKS
jgi:aldehyde dehydrogenase (NAD+)